MLSLRQIFTLDDWGSIVRFGPSLVIIVSVTEHQVLSNQIIWLVYAKYSLTACVYNCKCLRPVKQHRFATDRQESWHQLPTASNVTFCWLNVVFLCDNPDFANVYEICQLPQHNNSDLLQNKENHEWYSLLFNVNRTLE